MISVLRDRVPGFARAARVSLEQRRDAAAPAFGIFRPVKPTPLHGGSPRTVRRSTWWGASFEAHRHRDVLGVVQPVAGLGKPAGHVDLSSLVLGVTPAEVQRTPPRVRETR